MKKINLFIVVLISLLSSCKKNSFVYTDNKFYVFSVKEDFKSKYPLYIYSSSSLEISDVNGNNKKNISQTPRRGGELAGWISWAKKSAINPAKEVKLSVVVTYFNENSYTLMYNNLTGDYDKVFVSGAYNYQDELRYSIDLKLEPNAIYEWDPVGETIEIIGYNNDSNSGGGNNNNNNNSTNCDLANYNGPEFDIQVDSQCKTAYLYKCAGNEEGVKAACALYESYRSQWQGSGSLPVCPYCN